VPLAMPHLLFVLLLRIVVWRSPSPSLAMHLFGVALNVRVAPAQ
jgi:hypothetical protein